MDLLYNAQGLLVTHDAPNACLLIEWLGHHDGPAKQACCQTVLTLVEQTGVTKGLVNGMDDLDGWNEAIEWLGTVHQAALVALGVRAIAWVLPKNLAARLDVEQTVNRFLHPVVQPPHPMYYNTFDDVEAAYCWLMHRTVSALAAATASIQD